MKAISLLVLSLFAVAAVAAEPAVQIRFPQGKDVDIVARELGVTTLFFNQLVSEKLSVMSSRGECGLSNVVTLQSYSRTTSEDTAQEEIQYHDLSLVFDRLTMQIGLVEIYGSENYDPVEYFVVECSAN